jgi:hypothetical protein
MGLYEDILGACVLGAIFYKVEKAVEKRSKRNDLREEDAASLRQLEIEIMEHQLAQLKKANG